MGRQRNRPQMKEQENSPEELDEIEANNLSYREFRIMTIRILNSMKKDIETIKKNQPEIKNATYKIKNTLGREIFKVRKRKYLQPRLIYPARLSFKIKREIRSLPDKKKLKEFVNTKPILQQMLKGSL